MICKKCGSQLKDDDAFCMHCGAIVEDENKEGTKAQDKSMQVMKRLPFIFWTLIYYVAMFIHIGYFGSSTSFYNVDGVTNNFMLYMGINIFMMWLYAYFCMARRLRDCGMNTALAWLIIIPVISNLFMLYLFFPASKQIK